MNAKLAAFIFVLLCIFSAIFLRLIPSPPLLSPLVDQLLPPDLSGKLSQKLVASPVLDYSHLVTISTLSDKIDYLVYNPSSARVYLAKGQTKKISPGSFTKLITSQVALDITDSDERLLKATKDSINKEPTVLGLKEGEQLSVKDLVRACIATSANDAAATLAEGLADMYHQPVSYFVGQMNLKAKLLGLKNTYFVNPEGYDDDNQYSTLEDIFTIISNVQKNYPYILYSGQSDMEDISTSSAHGRYYLPNWNGLLGVYPGVDGLKIAYTEKAGYSTIVTAKRDNVPVVVILQGANSIRERDLAAAALLDAAYISEKIRPANITRTQLNQHYKKWTDLATKIKQELKLLETNNN